MSKVGFDVSRYLSPFGGDPLVGQKMIQQTLQDAARNQQADVSDFNARKLEREKMGQSAAFHNALMQDKLLQRAALAQRYQATGARADERLAMDKRKLENEEKRYQGDVDQEAAKGLLGPFASGDLNALAAAKAAAVAKDPTLGVYLPGEAGGGDRQGLPIPSVDEAYGPDELRVERGERTVFRGSPDAAKANEKAVAAAMLGPLGSKPYAVAGKEELAGQGMTGKDAGLFATKQQNALDDRAAREQNALITAGLRGDAAERAQRGQDTQLAFGLHDRIEKVKVDAVNSGSLKKLAEDEAAMGEIGDQLKLGKPLGDFNAFKGTMMRYTGKAMSNQEAEKAAGAAGYWEKLRGTLQNLTNESQLSPEYRAQLADATAAIQRYNSLRRLKEAAAGRDRIYSASQLPMSPEERVRAGAQVYTAIAKLPPLSEDQIQAELARVTGARPAKAAKPAVGDGWEPSVKGQNGIPADLPQDLGDTGGRPPSIPRVPAPAPRGPSPEELEELQMLEDEKRRLEAEGG